MPKRTAPPGSRYSGWWQDQVGTSQLELYVNSVLIATATTTAFTPAFAITSPTSLAASTTVTAGTSMAVTTTMTVGTGLTVTTGNTVNTAGDVRVTAGNLRLGVVSAFMTTEPTSAVVMKEGTNPVGAITTSGGIFCTTGGATLSKIIAAGTVSTIQT